MTFLSFVLGVFLSMLFLVFLHLIILVLKSLPNELLAIWFARVLCKHHIKHFQFQTYISRVQINYQGSHLCHLDQDPTRSWGLIIFELQCLTQHPEVETKTHELSAEVPYPVPVRIYS